MDKKIPFLGLPIVGFAFLGVIFCLDFDPFFFFSSLVPLPGVFFFNSLLIIRQVARL
jgi:hypothetical protein